jgi:hypothetical protein
MQRDIRELTEDLQNLDRLCANEADRMVNTLSGQEFTPGARRQFISDQIVAWSGYATNRTKPLIASQPHEHAPERRELGSYLGPFTLVASWLLRTESLSLASLIVGTIGFGLLGSACSSFVREKSDGVGHDEPLVRDLSDIIIRGVSAASSSFWRRKAASRFLVPGRRSQTHTCCCSPV